MSFSINCLEITAPKNIVKKNGNVYKNLLTEKDFEKPGFKLPKRFFFNDFYKRDPDANGMLIPNEKEKRFNSDLFFSKNINIQAIVGMNGCGKSSLLDLMYMAINNFCFMYERGRTLPGTSFLFYINNLYVNIYYSLQGEEYILNCEGEKVCLIIPKSDGINRKYNISELHTSIYTDQKIKKIVEPFFYTIASNYSLQSFISSNYLQEIKVFNKTTHVADNLNNVQIDGTQRKKDSDECFDSKTSWIDSIFHKNDGYVRSIVLNPFRDKGVIDMNREQQISKYRLISLLIKDSKESREKHLFRDYSLEKIEYEIDEDFILSKYPNCKSIQDIGIYLFGLKNSTNRDLMDMNEIFILLAQHYRCPPGVESSSCRTYSIYYLTYKINKIIHSYKTYDKYNHKKKYSIYGANRDDNFIKLLEHIENDKSHIISKIKQAMHFLGKIKKIEDIDENDDNDEKNYILGIDNLGYFDSSFTYDDYCSFFNNTFDSLDKIIEQLPPPIFRYKITLKSEKKGEFVNFDLLSSGELQMMHTLATHAYHIRNLMSINDEKRVKYSNINLIFDEVEICFHPEYQRLFIDKLIKMLESLQKKDYKFNVFIVTHSPFVLSDIPKSRILYLKDGNPDYGEKINSFAGNICEMMYDSFFLKSTIGAFAENKIKRLVNKKNGINSNTMTKFDKDCVNITDKEIESTFNEIGDTVIKCLTM